MAFDEQLAEERADAALDERHTRVMDMTGRPMKSMLLVEPAGVESDRELERWVGEALDLVARLPPR